MNYTRIIIVVMLVLAFVLLPAAAAPQLYLDQYNASHILSTHMNGTGGSHVFTDEKGNTITTIGSPYTDTSVKQLGTASGLFNGVNESLKITPATTNFNLSSSDFTIELWFKRTRTGTEEWLIGSKNGLYYNYRLDIETDNTIFVNLQNTTGASSQLHSTAITDTNFHQFVYERSGNTLYGWLDGVAVTPTSIIGEIPNVTSNINISMSSSGDWPFSGHIDEVNFWNGVAIPISELYPQPVEVETAIPPVATFTAVPTSGADPLFVQFTETSTSSGTSWVWNATNVTGNNAPFTFNSTSGSPVQMFSQGNYSISLKSTNAGGSNISTQVTFINVSAFIFAGFSSFNTAGTAPFTTYLYDQSTNLTGSETFSWLLGDGNTSTSKDLYYTWNITGTYSVNHSVSNGITTSWKNVSDMITVGTPVPPVVAPVASFYGGPQLGGVPLTVFFTDVSTNTPTSWNWSFGDGAYSELQNPSHAYTRSGFRTVNLTATNSAGSNVTTRLKFVKVS